MTFSELKNDSLDNITVATVEVSVLSNPVVCVTPSVNNNTTTVTSLTSQDALFYIITVLMFYACSIIILLVKYVKREKQEAAFTHYYYEYVTREKFQNPIYQNRQQLNKIMKAIKIGRGSKVKPKDPDLGGGGGISKIYIDYTLLQETQV